MFMRNILASIGIAVLASPALASLTTSASLSDAEKALWSDLQSGKAIEVSTSQYSIIFAKPGINGADQMFVAYLSPTASTLQVTSVETIRSDAVPESTKRSWASKREANGFNAPTVVQVVTTADQSLLGAQVEVEWSATNAAACVLRAPGSDPVDIETSGKRSVELPAGEHTIQVDCAGFSEPGSATTDVAVVPPVHVELAAPSEAIISGSESPISWVATGRPTGCTAEVNGNEFSGETGVIQAGELPAGTHTVTVTCTNGVSTDVATASISVQEPADPELTVVASAERVATGEHVDITWGAIHADTCSATGTIPGLSEDLAVTGSVTIPTEQAGIFKSTITCTGLGGTASHEAQLIVKAPQSAAGLAQAMSPITVAHAQETEEPSSPDSERKSVPMLYQPVSDDAPIEPRPQDFPEPPPPPAEEEGEDVSSDEQAEVASEDDSDTAAPNAEAPRAVAPPPAIAANPRANPQLSAGGAVAAGASITPPTIPTREAAETAQEKDSDEPSTPESRSVITVADASTQIIPIALNHLNRIVTPFSNPLVRTVSAAEIERRGHVLYVATGHSAPVTMFVTEAGREDVAISLTLWPRKIPPREIVLQLAPSYAMAVGPVASGNATEFEAQPYVKVIRDLMRKTAVGEVPPGYRLRARADTDPGIFCADPQLRVTPAQVIEGQRYIVTVSKVTNISANNVEIIEDRCHMPGVLAVAAFPAVFLPPGGNTEMYTVHQKIRLRNTNRSRPSLLTD